MINCTGLPPESMDMDADAKMKKFAESLIRQRELRQQQTPQHSRQPQQQQPMRQQQYTNQQQLHNEPRIRRKSTSPKRNRGAFTNINPPSLRSEGVRVESSSDTVSVIRRNDQQNIDARKSPEQEKRKNSGRIRRSSSLSELPQLTNSWSNGGESQQQQSPPFISEESRSVSNSNNHVNQRHLNNVVVNNPMISGPSSSTSSCGTVVPHHVDEDSDGHYDKGGNLLDDVEVPAVVGAGVDDGHIGGQLSRLSRNVVYLAKLLV